MLTIPPREVRSAAGLVRRWRQASDPQELADTYGELRAAGPLVPTPWRALLVPGYEDCRQVLTDRTWRTLSASWRDQHRPGWRESSSTVGLCETPLQQDPPEHTARRRPLAGILTPRAVGQLTEARVEPLVDGQVRAFVDRLRREGTADLVAAVCRPTPTAVLARLLGLPPDTDQAWLTDQNLALVQAEELASPPSAIRRADAAATALLACYDRMLADRRRHPADDILSHWAASEPVSARYLLLTLFSAGVPTTAALLASLALALTTRPGLAERILLEPDLTDRFVTEVLRWDAPVRVVTRVAADETELAGRSLPAGQIVHALIGAAHRDPEVFTDPHTFRPNRPPRRLLALGSGLHYCLGAHLARAQAVAFVRAFARELRGARLAAAPRRQTGPSFIDITHLPISASVHHSPAA
ncbi:cytochrome P450 [Streptomyces gobiensis]|uniref:cytochrome P450 n=1 Tax=Streptomyces gobiensis TaxID=2875706 RepID=UPI001E54FFF7|nr:cytochrome P450 [Streptomyces gobiensis]UGY91518.1 cytochrome P450 [Streptomyces gobiensis]